MDEEGREGDEVDKSEAEEKREEEAGGCEG